MIRTERLTPFRYSRLKPELQRVSLGDLLEVGFWADAKGAVFCERVFFGDGVNVVEGDSFVAIRQLGWVFELLFGKPLAADAEHSVFCPFACEQNVRDDFLLGKLQLAGSDAGRDA